MKKQTVILLLSFTLGIAVGVTLMVLVIYSVWLAPLQHEIIVPNYNQYFEYTLRSILT